MIEKVYSIENLRKEILRKKNEIKERNRIRVKMAEQYYNDGFLNASKGLFEKSLKICQEQHWKEGINYASKMIEEINDKIDAFNKTHKS